MRQLLFLNHKATKSTKKNIIATLCSLGLCGKKISRVILAIIDRVSLDAYNQYVHLYAEIFYYEDKGVTWYGF